MEINQIPVLEDPPVRNRGRGRKADPIHEAAAQLGQSNPGRWVKVGTFKSSQASQIKEGKHQSYPGPAGTWDATVRSTPEGKTLWVCFEAAA